MIYIYIYMVLMFSAAFRDDTASIRVSVLIQWRPDTTTLVKLIIVGAV